MLHPTDLETFARATGGRSPSAEFLVDAERLSHMLHRCTTSGALGPQNVCLLALLHGYESPTIPVETHNLDWQKITPGVRVLVQRRDDPPKRGVFQGLTVAATLAVDLDDEAGVREYLPRYVSLDVDDQKPAQQTSRQDRSKKTDAKKELAKA